MSPWRLSAAEVLRRYLPGNEAERPPVSGGSDELDRWWGRIIPIWHVLYLGLLALAAVTTLIDVRLGADQRWAAAGLIAVMAAGYLVLGVRLFEEPGPLRAVLYLSLTWSAFYGILLVTSGDTSAFLLLFGLFPQVWAFLPSPRAAAAASLVGICGMTLTLIHLGGWGWTVTVRHVPEAIMQAGLVLLMGLLIVGVVNQAESRAAVIDELEATRSELAETERARGVLAERERLAREIHDTLAQGFTSVLTLAQAIDASLERDPDAVRERLALLERTARDNLAETRALVNALAPVDLQQANLPEAVRRVAARFSDETGVRTEIREEGSRVAIPVHGEIVLLRAVQESLANVGKHAAASQVRITISFLPEGHGLASVSVTDDGRGFLVERSEGFGLRGMRSRAQQVGGGLEVVSAPGAGTTVRVHVPISA
ncbi:sensor histidine kinase [Phytoactinopolyspora alkaliphila]|uniref:Oxygen sensor histidine kinase NreB n=1 Tax=Phytoactinopolyspora alkaliphila TaxID=1783498 RepID=A0A6N9YRJ2_9ACTN|nr:sensor histidine kinase [Phytoactinopolyspora alkaliphila]